MRFLVPQLVLAFVLTAGLIGMGLGCANSRHNCGNRVLLPWPAEQGGYSFQEIELDTLSSIYTLRGPVAEVYVEGHLAEDGYSGSVAEPRVTDSGDICVPQDVQSSMALSAYAQMERLHSFEQELGVAQQISWPRKVGIDIRLSGQTGLRHNNAHYFARQDVVAVIPYNVKNGIPMGINHGVFAHEHFHAHFQHLVIAPLNARLGGLNVDDLEHADVTMKRGVNSYVLRGWNEGLADFYASVYIRRTEFLSETLPTRAKERDLDGVFTRMATGEEFAAEIRRVRSESPQPEVLVNVSYSQGTQLARLLYRLSLNGALPPRTFLAGIMKNLSRIPSALVSKFETEV
ncbi:MAG: hypothetical protein AB7P49_19385, partial [Bdellovibrionales bacterium]